MIAFGTKLYALLDKSVLSYARSFYKINGKPEVNLALAILFNIVFFEWDLFDTDSPILLTASKSKHRLRRWYLGMIYLGSSSKTFLLRHKGIPSLFRNPLQNLYTIVLTSVNMKMILGSWLGIKCFIVMWLLHTNAHISSTALYFKCSKWSTVNLL